MKVRVIAVLVENMFEQLAKSWKRCKRFVKKIRHPSVPYDDDDDNAYDGYDDDDAYDGD